MGNKELIFEIDELHKQLSDLKVAYAALQEENLVLKQKIQALEKNNEEPPVLKKGAYYLHNGDGPFCPSCYGKDKKLILLAKTPSQMRIATHLCGVCKTPYTLK